MTALANNLCPTSFGILFGPSFFVFRDPFLPPSLSSKSFCANQAFFGPPGYLSIRYATGLNGPFAKKTAEDEGKAPFFTRKEQKSLQGSLDWHARTKHALLLLLVDLVE